MRPGPPPALKEETPPAGFPERGDSFRPHGLPWDFMTWELRRHPLRGEWVVVATHRQDRPWQGFRASPGEASPPAFDPDCPFCPGNTRVGGARNPDYRGVFAFDNDRPCVGEEAPEPGPTPGGPYRTRRALGKSRVLCYHPRHDLSLARMKEEEVLQVVRAWREERRTLSRIEGVEHVFLFENRGKEVGVSNPHPHCQVYAVPFVFETIRKEAEISRRHARERGGTLLGAMLEREKAQGTRIVAEREGMLAFVPFCARFAYETWIAPLRPVEAMEELEEGETRALAGLLRSVLARLDNLWKSPMPYILASHDAPACGARGFHFHLEIYPLLRKPGLLKHLAGPETGGGSFLADTCPEEKAAELREAPEIHYLEGED